MKFVFIAFITVEGSDYNREFISSLKSYEAIC